MDIRRQLGVISLWSNDCLINSCWYYSRIYPMIAWNSYHMHYIEIIIGKRSNFDQKSKFPWHWTLKFGDFNWKRQGGITRQENATKFGKNDCWPRPLIVDQAIDRFVRARAPPPPAHALHLSHFLLHSFPPLHIPASKRPFWPYFGPIAGWGLDFGTP